MNICPKPQVTELSRTLFSLHIHYQNGYLPFSGGLLEQPNAYLQAMEILDALKARNKNSH